MKIMIPYLVFMSVVFLSIYFFVFKKYVGRKSPITNIDLMERPAGYSVSREVQKANEQLLEFTSLGMVVVAVLAVMSVSQNTATMVGLYLIALVPFPFYIRKLLKIIENLRAYQDAYISEMAVGQALNGLLKDGFFVFHDIQADGFNIDHMLVGPTGVFAIETKSRRKPKGIKGFEKNSHVVSGQQDVLNFPGWKDAKILPQAQRQADWASKWLSESVGTAIQIMPLVVLPGWYIENIQSANVKVVNHKMLGARTFTSNQQLTDSQIKSIAYQIKQRCQLGDLV